MNLLFRLVLGAIISLILGLTTLHYLNIPPDQFLPPPTQYSNATAVTHGKIVDTKVSGYADHWWAGTSNQYIMDYEFRSVTHVVGANGKTKAVPSPTLEQGSVMIDDSTFDSLHPSATSANPPTVVLVHYDPLNPLISGVNGTLGGMNTAAGFIGPWLWYGMGLVVLVIVFEELLKRFLPSD